jgi:hypothetical protein
MMQPKVKKNIEIDVGSCYMDDETVSESSQHANKDK